MKLPQITLRELFLLVVIAAMGCGWWVEQQQASLDTARLRSEVEELRLLFQRLKPHYTLGPSPDILGKYPEAKTIGP